MSLRRAERAANINRCRTHLLSVLSLTGALCVVRGEPGGGGQLSHDVGAAHQLGEHVAVPHEFRIERVPLCFRR